MVLVLRARPAAPAPRGPPLRAGQHPQDPGPQRGPGRPDRLHVGRVGARSRRRCHGGRGSGRLARPRTGRRRAHPPGLPLRSGPALLRGRRRVPGPRRRPGRPGGDRGVRGLRAAVAGRGALGHHRRPRDRGRRRLGGPHHGRHHRHAGAHIGAHTHGSPRRRPGLPGPARVGGGPPRRRRGRARRAHACRRRRPRRGGPGGCGRDRLPPGARRHAQRPLRVRQLVHVPGHRVDPRRRRSRRPARLGHRHGRAAARREPPVAADHRSGRARPSVHRRPHLPHARRHRRRAPRRARRRGGPRGRRPHARGRPQRRPGAPGGGHRLAGPGCRAPGHRVLGRRPGHLPGGHRPHGAGGHSAGQGPHSAAVPVPLEHRRSPWLPRSPAPRTPPATPTP